MRNKWCSLLLFLFLIGTGAPSCGPAERETQEQAERISVTDDLGRQLQIPERPRRIIALAPSMTEMLFAVCADSTIIGRTQNCNYPAAVLNKPVVNNYPMDYEMLLNLKPDLIFTTDGITSLEVADRLQDLGIPVYFQRYEQVADVLRGLQTIGQIMGRQEQAKHLTDSLQVQIDAIRQAHHMADSPSVLVLTWSDPIYVYGRNTLMTDKIRLAGGRNAMAEVFDQPFPAITREYVLKLNPDVILGGTYEKLEESFFGLYPELRQIKAYRSRKIFAPTGDLTARPSPRVVESIREIKSLIH